MDDSESPSPLEEPLLSRRMTELPRKHRSSKDREKILLGGSSRELARLLVYQERDAKDLRKMLSSVTEQLKGETRRADAAEDKAREAALRFKGANEDRILAQQEAARAKEALGLYKLQLATAQKEIHRAQELLDSLEAQRLEAEESAARARSMARKLKEEKLAQLAREEGRRLGMEEGLARGQNIGYEEGRAEGYARGQDAAMRMRPYVEDVEDAAQTPSDEQRGDVRQPSRSSGSSSRGYEQERLSNYSQPLRRTTPAPTVVTTDPPFPQNPHVNPPHDNEIHPIPVHMLNASPSHPYVEIPPDGWIPMQDGDSRIRIPPPHELGPPPPTPSPPPSVVLLGTADTADAKPVMIPPPIDHAEFAVSDTESIAEPPHRRPRHARRRSSESQSTTMSQFELLGPPVAPNGRSALRERPVVLSAIAEERERTSSASSPVPRPGESYQSPYLQSSNSSFYMPQGPSPQTQTQSVDTTPIRLFSHNQNIYTRPRSPDSSSDSAQNARPMSRLRSQSSLRPPSQASDRRQSLNSEYRITVEPPSRPESNHSGIVPMTPNLLSAGDADRPLPTLPEDNAAGTGVNAQQSFGQPVIPSLSSQSASAEVLEDQLPPGFVPNSRPVPPSTFTPQPSMPPPLPPSLRLTSQDMYVKSISPAGVPLPPSSYGGTLTPSIIPNMAPGAFFASEPVVIPHLPGTSPAPNAQPVRRYSRSALRDSSSSESDAVSSGISSSMNTLTTPPDRRKKLPKQAGPTYAVAPVPPNIIYPVPTPRLVPSSLSGAAMVPLPPSAAGSVSSGAARVPLPASAAGSVMSPSSSQSHLYSRTPYSHSNLGLDGGRTSGRMNTPLSPVMGSARADPTPLPIPMPFPSPLQQAQQRLSPHDLGNDPTDDFMNAPIPMPEPIVIPSEQLSRVSPMSSFISLAPSNATSKGAKKTKKKVKGR
ncbi:hypothetical protein BKA93DRAFT_823662 [Sparassis latifolia]|uniref:Uncharacterized protein n=1 Tax=Sparassis crispa TaxID=139825 RepID=A0A401GD43_9APHY|nr:predicted protein [Sparassis crispa]GBE80104.1 predicted protein [Sparassis crispa]